MVTCPPEPSALAGAVGAAAPSAGQEVAAAAAEVAVLPPVAAAAEELLEEAQAVSPVSARPPTAIRAPARRMRGRDSTVRH